MTVSYWRRTDRLGSLSCDALVIGAGICGISAALHLQRRGLSTIVVERDRAGSGASTRNAGFLMRGCADCYAAAAREFGRERAKFLWRLTEENLAGLRREGVGQLAGTRDVPSVLAALREDEVHALRESEAMMREDGFEVGWQDGSRNPGDSLWRHAKVLVALVNPGDASCNSREVIEHLRSRLVGPVHEGQEVFEMHADGDHVVVRTTDGRIRARHVLACTNAYAPLLLPGLAGHVTPRRGQMLALRASASRSLAGSYYINFGSEYLRQHADGTIVVGGCRTYHAEREVGYEDTVTPWVQADLEQFARRALGEFGEEEIIARWAGTMGFSRTHLPLVGRAWGPNSAEGKVWFCGGFTGHGMSMAYRVSEMAVEAMVEGAGNAFEMRR
jgi:glycine/D-amino acid oxidase-like deaminating enzyme